jgi:hypothetical protein
MSDGDIIVSFSNLRGIKHTVLFGDIHICPSCGSTGDVIIGFGPGSTQIGHCCKKCKKRHGYHEFIPPKGCLQVIGEAKE